MIKRIIVAGMLCLFATPSFAQNIAIDFNKGGNQDKVSPKVREKMDEFQIQIREIVNQEKANLDAEIQKVDKELAENKITKEEANERREELAITSSDLINERIQAVNFDLDELIKKQVAFSILNGNDAETVPTKSDLEKKHRATHNITGYIGYGFMGFSEKQNEELDNRLGFANNFELGLTYNKQFNRQSPWSLKSGMVFSWRTIRLDDDYKFVRDADGNTGLIHNETQLDKSKLRGSYLVVPLGLQYTFGKNVTIDDFTYYKEKDIAITANVYGGVKLANNNIVKGDNVSFRDKKDYNLNPFIYGAQLTFKINSVNIYARKEFSNYFDKNTFDDRKMFQVGINFGF